MLQRRGQRLLDRAERSSSEAGIVRAECAELDGESAMERRSARCAACCHQTLSRPRTRTDHFAQGPSPAVLPPSYLRGVNTAEAARNTRYVLSSSKPLAFPDLSAAPRASGNAGVTSFARWLLAAYPLLPGRRPIGNQIVADGGVNVLQIAPLAGVCG